MKTALTLSKAEARQIMIASLGLKDEPSLPAEKKDLLAAIRQIHALQIDTISVVARAHLHILWSRIGGFDIALVDELQREGAIFEYFAHALCYLPIEDYPLWRSVMLNKYTGWIRLEEWAKENAAFIQSVLAHIRDHGAVKSADFTNAEPENRWGTRKFESMAMAHLFHCGDLMVAYRENFQRVFDLRERVHPAWKDEMTPDYTQSVGQLAVQAVKALGMAREDWAADYFYLPKRIVYPFLKNQARNEKLHEVRVEGIAKPLYLHPESMPLIALAQAGKLHSTRTTILSPFDPLLNHRGRARELFNFDYTIECYTPIAKRVYGYFTLPILHQGALVGRLDAKAWRKECRLQIIKLHLEPTTEPDSDLTVALAKALRAYASWQGLKDIHVDWAQSEIFRTGLNSALS